MTSMMAVKLRRDLRATWPRLLMMVVAIAVSLTVSGGVLLAWSAADREISGAYTGTEPASATIVLDDHVDASTLAALADQARERPGVIEAVARTQFTTDISVNGEPRDVPLQVFVAAPDDPMRMATFEIEDSRWPPAADELLIRQDALSLLDVAVGDTVTVEAPGGGSLRLQVADTVYDPSLAPSPQQQIGAGYLSLAALAGTGDGAVMDQLKIQVAGPDGTAPTRDRETAEAVGRDVGRWLQTEQDLAVREIQVPEPYTHPHQGQADALLLSLLAAGAAALLLSTILVANMLNNLFTQQIPQIGILKAIGARAGRIGGLYLTMTLVVAAAATLLAIGPAILIGRTAVEALSGFLGVEPVSLGSPWWTYASIVAVGLGLPVLMALGPLLKASRITVRAAIDHHGGGSKPNMAAGALARLSRIPGFNRGLLMALRNTVRRPARFLLSVGLLATAGAVFVAGMSLNTSTQAIDDQRREQRTWDVEVQLARPAAADEVAALVRGLPEVTAVEGFNRAPTGVAGTGEIPVTRTYPDQGHGSISVTTVSDNDTMRPQPKVLEGRWLEPSETGAIVLNQVTLKNAVPDVAVGDTVELVIAGAPTSWRVVGIVEEREGGSGGTYVTAEGFAQATGAVQQFNQLLIATTSDEEQTRIAVAQAAESALTGAGIEVQAANSVSRSDEVSAGHLGPILLVLLGVALPLGVIGIIGLASIMSTNVLDRTREFGVMHAIGALPRTVRRIVVAEGVFLAIISCLVAAIPAVILAAVLGAGLGNLFMSAPLPFRISLIGVGIWLALVVLGAVLATESAASRASRLTVREALSYL